MVVPTSPAAPDSRLLNRCARTATTSAIRDLLDHAQRSGMLSLAGGLPDPALFPVQELAHIAEHVLRHDGARVLQYGLTAGERSLREHIVETTPEATSIDEVVITTGSQQGLQLLAGVLVDTGDVVVVGDPEYLGATQAFRRAGATLFAVPSDTGGLDVDSLETAVHAGLRPKLVYLVPHFHNPSGASLDADRHRRLLALADRFGFLVVLDDPYRELFVAGAAPVSCVPHASVIHLRSVSKVLAPGLRVGWLVGPTWLAAAVERAKQTADLHTSTVAQAIVHRALTADWYDTHLDRLRAAGLRKRDAMCDALENRLGDRVSFSRPAGGMFVWAEIPEIDSTETLLAAALARGVAFVPGSAFSVERDLARHVRLSWATLSPSELATAVDRFALAMHD